MVPFEETVKKENDKIEMESNILAQRFKTAYDILSSLERIVDRKLDNES